MTYRRLLFGLVALAAVLSLAGSAQPVAQQCFLKIAGVPGESTDRHHKGWIEIESFSFSPNPQRTSRRAAAGPGQLSVVVRMEKSTPKLMQYCAEGKHFPQGKLSCRKARREGQGYLQYELRDLIVTSYQTGGTPERPTEEVTFNYRKIEWQWVPQEETQRERRQRRRY